MRISAFVHDLASNPIVRAFPVLEGLCRLGHEVEIIGLLISGSEVFEPYRNRAEYVTIRSSGTLVSVATAAARLAHRATGDAFYAFKPLLTSYWPALLASRFGRRGALLLDVEDNELWPDVAGPVSFAYQHVLRGWNTAGALRYKAALHLLTPLAKHVTVSSTYLRARHGGTILLHGPDESIFDPGRSEFDQQRCRELLRLPKGAPLALFAGTPHHHKGLDIIINGLCLPSTEQLHLVLAGPENHPTFQEAARRLGRRCHLLGHVANADMPALLAAVDIVPTLQRANGFTAAQIPGKLLEAMAMEKTVVVTPVSDLVEIVGSNAEPRGWVVPCEDPVALANTIATILGHPEATRRRQLAAREFFLQRASTAAISDTLAGIVGSCGIC
jgi:glycosyltransferase involved in cell wall biosynthesis